MSRLIVRKKQDSSNFGWLKSHWERPVERIFTIYGVPTDSSRGYHRHKRCQMGLTCVIGSVSVYVQTPDEDQFYWLNSPAQTLLLEPTDWRIMYAFSADAVLMVLADRTFCETVYINSPYRPLPVQLPLASQHGLTMTF